MLTSKKTVAKIIAENLNALMHKNPRLNTQVKLAKKSGVGQSSVGRVRRGEIAPTVDTVEALAKAFGLRAVDLLRDYSEEAAGMAPQLPSEYSRRVERMVGVLSNLNAEKLSALEVLLDLKPMD